MPCLLPAYRCSSSLCCLISISRNQCHTFFPPIGAALHCVASFQSQETSAIPSSRLSVHLFTMLPHFNLKKPVPYLLPAYRCSSSLCCLISISRNQCHTFFPPIGASLHYVASFQSQETSTIPSSHLSVHLFTMLPHFNLQKPVPYLLPVYRCSSSLCCLISISRNQYHTFFPPIGAALHYVASFQFQETSATPSSRLSVQLFTMLPHFNLKKPVPYLLPAYRCISLLCCLISISRNRCHTFFPPIGAALHYVASFQFQETRAIPSSRLSVKLFTMLPHFNLKKPVPYLLPAYRCISLLCCLISISRNRCHTFFPPIGASLHYVASFQYQETSAIPSSAYRCSSSQCCLISISRNQCHTFFPPIGASLHYVASLQYQETSAIPSSRLSVHLFTMLPHFNLKKPVPYLLPAYRCSSSLCCLISISRNQCHTFFPPIGASLHYVASFQSQETSTIPSSHLSVHLFTMLPHFNLQKPVPYLLPVYRCSSSLCCLISISRNQYHTFFPPIGAALHYVASFQFQETSATPSSRLSVQLFTMLPHFNLKKPVPYFLPAYRCSSSLCCLISISRNQCHTSFRPIGAALHYVASFKYQETSAIPSSRLSVQLFTMLPHLNIKKPVPYLLPAYRCSSSLCCLISISRNQCHTFFRLSVQLFTMLPHFNFKKLVPHLPPVYRCSSSLCCLISISRNQCHTFFPPIGAALHYVASFQSQETNPIPHSGLSVQLFTMLPHFNLKEPVPHLLPPIDAALHYVASFQSQETSAIPSSRLLVQLFTMLPHFNFKKPVPHLLSAYRCISSLCCLISISRNQCHTFFPPIGAALHYVASFQSQETTAMPSSRLSVQLLTMLPDFNLKKPVSHLLPAYRCSSSLCCLISISRNQCHTFFRLSVQLFTMLPHFNLKKPVPYLLPAYRCSS